MFGDHLLLSFMFMSKWSLYIALFDLGEEQGGCSEEFRCDESE